MVLSEKPVLASSGYDFDKTLSPDDMQAQGYIQSVKYDVQKFWKESNELATANDMDTNLAYMYMMIQASYGKFVICDQKCLDELRFYVLYMKGERLV